MTVTEEDLRAAHGERGKALTRDELERTRAALEWLAELALDIAREQRIRRQAPLARTA